MNKKKKQNRRKLTVKQIHFKDHHNLNLRRNNIDIYFPYVISERTTYVNASECEYVMVYSSLLKLHTIILMYKGINFS